MESRFAPGNSLRAVAAQSTSLSGSFGFLLNAAYPDPSSNGGKLEVAQQMANHESARPTGLYDRHNDEVSLDEVKRILI